MSCARGYTGNICRREDRTVRHGRVPAGALAAGIADQAMARWHFPAGVPGLDVKAENGVLHLGWKGRMVVVASAFH